MTTVGILHPGEMGAAIGAALVDTGREVFWVSSDRSGETEERADAAGLTAKSDLADLVSASDLIVSVCPPHAALEVAELVCAHARPGEPWLYLDANAIAPSTAERVARSVAAAGATYIDGGIIGPPPKSSGTTRLYLSGPAALQVSEILSTPLLEVHVIGERAGDASALKLAYAAWTKGSAALLLAVRAAAARTGVEDALLLEWRTSQPELVDKYETAQRSAQTKGWRWAGEMEEIAAMFESVGLPSGFHLAAAEVFGRPPF